MVSVTPTNGRPMTPIPAYILSEKDNSIANVVDSPPTAITRDLIKQLQKGVDALKKKKGEKHLDVAVAIDAVGRASSDNRDYDAAIHHFNDALKLKKSILPQHHPSIADTLRSVGDVSQKIGLTQESETAYKAAHTIYRNAFDDRSWVTDSHDSKQQIDYDLHHMISTTLVHIGTIEYQRKEFDQALHFYKEAQKEAKMGAIDAVVLDRHNTDTESDSLVRETRMFISVIMNNIANTHAQLNNKQLAFQTYNSALNLQMQEVGEDHISVSCTLHNMGTMHYQTGELQLSLKCYKQVLKMRRFLLGNEHPSIADSLMNIAIVHEKAGELDRAESALNATYRVVCKAYGEDDFRVGFVQDCLGALNARNGCNAEALGCFSKALKIYKGAAFSDDHPLICSTKESINFVKNIGTGATEDQTYDMMGSFLVCGGFCFTNNISDMKPSPVLV